MRQPLKGTLLPLSLILLGAVVVLGACGGGAAESGGGTTATTSDVPVGPRLRLLHLHHAEELVVLRLDLSVLRGSPRYHQLEEDLANSSGLSQGTIAGAEAMIDRADEAVGVLFPGAGGEGADEEGVLFANGRFTAADFQTLLQMAETEGGSAPTPVAGAPADRQIYALGDATIAHFTDQTWAIGHGARARELLMSVSEDSHQPRTFEIGPRVGLPAGSMQAWANQNSEAGVQAFALVMAGDRPEMVSDLVHLVRQRIGADPRPAADAPEAAAAE